jgi:hypothetical protein
LPVKSEYYHATSVTFYEDDFSLFLIRSLNILLSSTTAYGRWQEVIASPLENFWEISATLYKFIEKIISAATN